ncbi:hypothetical protein PhCBS80983_g00545 [Powellomyces hirtus]|uniref:Leo1-like protein n=1 Tax=Powellomyces hirtus TaxID=109895 RepID=A0A507EDP2_9FUNG|nr:hypothetical protein PhCBS80983_g00545 [Powellomyces hirtus]
MDGLFGSDSSDNEVEAKAPAERRQVDSSDNETEAKSRSARRRILSSDDESGEEEQRIPPVTDSREISPKRRREASSSRSRSGSRERSRSNSRLNREAESSGAEDAESTRSQPAVDAEEADLFGDIQSSDEEPERKHVPIVPRRERRERPVVKASCIVPDVPRFSQGNEEVFLARLPTWMGVDHRPFEAQSWDEEDEIPADPSIASHITLENTMRWRTVRDPSGEERKESNARLVRWSDGSTSLILGGEVFDANYMQGAPHQYITVSIPEAGVLQTQNRTPRNMTFKPYSRSSVVHQKLTKHISTSRDKDVSQTKMIVTMMDPEKEREAMEKAENEKIRARKRLEAKRRNASSGSRGLSARDLDGDSDDEATYLRGNTNIRRALDTYEDDFVVEDDEDEDDDEEEEREIQNTARLSQAKRQEKRHTSESTSRRQSEAVPPVRAAPSQPTDAHEDEDREIGVKRAKKKRHIISSDEDD